MVGATDVFYGQFLSALEVRKTLFNDPFRKVYIGHPTKRKVDCVCKFSKDTCVNTKEKLQNKNIVQNVKSAHFLVAL